MFVHQKLWSYIKYILQGHIKIYLESFSSQIVVWMSALTSILFLLLLKRYRFHGNAIAKSVAVRKFKICLSVCLSKHLFGLKIKCKFIYCHFVHLFEITYLSLYLKNCDYILDTFYRVTSKSWMYTSDLTFVKESNKNGIFMYF